MVSKTKNIYDGWTGKVVKLYGDPANGGRVLVEHEFEGMPAQRLYSALELMPVLKITSPFVRTSWMQNLYNSS